MIFLRRSKAQALVETIRWFVGRRRRVRVVGASMEPTLLEGEFVLVDMGRLPNPGELVLARHPERDLWVLKRAARWSDTGDLEVSSDNPVAGTDSRVWGPIARNSVLGTVTVVLGASDRPLS